MKSINNSPSLNQSPDSIVVKVCNISEEVKLEAARREVKVLRQLNCDYINKFVDFYEDPTVNKAYLVLEYAGVQSLGQYIEEKKLQTQLDEEHEGPIFSEDFIHSIMR